MEGHLCVNRVDGAVNLVVRVGGVLDAFTACVNLVFRALTIGYIPLELLALKLRYGFYGNI